MTHFELLYSTQLRPNPTDYLSVWSSISVQSKELLIRATLDGHIGKLVWALPYGACRPG
jgi:hypothetical protein